MKISGILLLTSIVSFSSCEQWDHLEAKAERINRYENVSLHLSKENRNLKSEISRYRAEIQTLKSEKSYLKIQLEKYQDKSARSSSKGSSRKIASIAPVNAKKDLVKFDIYKWTPSQVQAMAQKEFESKNYEKSAQFFKTFSTRFPGHKSIDDQFLFQAGVASFESRKHPKWTIEHLDQLVKAYPTSKYYRGAKLWMALTYLQLGDDQKFFSTVEEFRKKYRNTEEWKILSPHYEKIVQKYKSN